MMKKAVLSLFACASIGLTANAQLPVGSVAPDFTLQDINGVTHNLYNYLDSGYTVIIDISAAWCGPCWAVHQSGVFKNLTTHYGPNGTTTPGKIKVLYVEGESGNTTAQLHGTPGSGSAQSTQGDWVTGTNFPIIDNSSLNTPYMLGGFPTFTVICRDRLVAYSSAGYTQAMLTESFWVDIADMDCPSYAPSVSVDAKAVPYVGTPYYLCNAAPTVKFQNYSQAPLTSATIEVLNGSNVVATVPWTGNLAPMGIQTVSVPSFNAPAAQPYKFRVVAAGDTYPANNESADSIFKVFLASSAKPVPTVTTFEGSFDFPDYFGGPQNGYAFITYGSQSTPMIGANGQSGNGLVIYFYDMLAGQTTEVFAGNYDGSTASIVSLDFDVAYAQFSASSPENDKLEVQLSNDCGATWTTVWTKSGDALKTVPPVSPGVFIPTSNTHWRHEGVDLTPHKSNNMMLRIKATSDYGNLAWIDNFKIHNSTSVNEVITESSVSIFPNPAKDEAVVRFSMKEKAAIDVQVFDATGRVVLKTISETLQAGENKISINTSNLPSGLYHVRINTESGSHIERLSIVK